MATYSYDDLQVTLTPRDDGAYDMESSFPDGSSLRTVFTVSIPVDQLEQAVVSMARTRSRIARGEPATREVEPADDDMVMDAVQLGGALADALFAGGVGAAYDAARSASSAAQRGLRLTLSLGGAPALLSLPWEFLYRRPRFLASQRHTPLVRRLDTGSATAPPAITSTVRILGVVASPGDLAPLDVTAERARVEQAVAKMVTAGRVQLDWLEPATPRRLREALRDSSYHVLHYVGHSTFTSEGTSAIYLQDDSGTSTAVDNTVLANLLSDQNTLRLVVLNSCEGARTTLSDPYAGVATTLIELGVPAVVAMQFEISDKAAILFADELYTNLIGRQDPIDAAVAEARKAIYIEIDRVEWGTPVLFVRDPDVQLFDFKLPVAPLPPPPPPELRDPISVPEPSEDDAAIIRRPPVKPARNRVVTAGIGVAAALAVAGSFLLTNNDGNTGSGTTSTAGTAETSTVATAAATSTSPTVPVVVEPRPRTGFVALQILEAVGDVHVYAGDPPGSLVAVTTKGKVRDTQPVWDRATNRIAFTRSEQDQGEGTAIKYVVPGNLAGDAGKQVAPLVPWTPGEFDHFPAWTANGALFYMRTDGCAPAADCPEELRRAEFVAADDGKGYLDALTHVSSSDRVVIPRFVGVTAVAADPVRADVIVVADTDGLWLVGVARSPTLFAQGAVTTSLTFTPDGSFIVALDEGVQGRSLRVYTPGGELVADSPVVDDGSNLRLISITGDAEGRTLLALSVSSTDPSAASLSRLLLNDDGTVQTVDIVTIPDLAGRGQAQAVAR